MGGAIGLWVAAEWRRRWPALIGLAVLVALAGGAATALRRRRPPRRHRIRPLPRRHRRAQPGRPGQPRRGRADQRRRPPSASAPTSRRSTSSPPWTASSRSRSSRGGRSPCTRRWTPRAGDGVRHGHVRHGRRAAAADRHRRSPPRRRRPQRRDDQRGSRPGDGPRGRQHADVRDGLADRLLEWASNDGQFASADALDGPTIEVRVAAVTRTEADLEAPFPLIEFSEGFARAHGDDIAHVEPLVEVRADPDRLEAVAADVEAVLAPYELEMTTTDAPGAAILPSIEVGVSTLWIATAVTAVGGLLLVGQALGRLVAASATDHPALAAMGLTRPQQALGSIAVAMVGIAAGALAVPLVAWSGSGLFPAGRPPSPNPTRGCAGTDRRWWPVPPSRSSPRRRPSPSSPSRHPGGRRGARVPAGRSPRC